MTKLFVFSLFIILISGCSNLGSKKINYSEYITTENLAKSEKIDSFIVKDWIILDDSHLLVISKPNNHYLLSTKKDCVDLEKAERIAFKTSQANKLLSGIDYLSTLGDNPDCLIVDIRDLHEVQYGTLQNTKIKTSRNNPTDDMSFSRHR